MMRIAAVIFLVAAISAPVESQTPASAGPFVRAHLEPEKPVNVGETVDLVIEIFVPTWFPSAPVFPELDVPGTMTRLSDDALNLNERVQNESWPGIQRRYRMVVQAPGRIQVPPVQVTVIYAIDAKPSPPRALTTEPLSFEARMPPGAEALDYFFASSSLHLSEKFDRKLDTLRVGDAFVRTITLSAESDSAMSLPAVALDAPDGIRLHVDPPETAVTGGERGAARVATRVERGTYIAEREGRYTLPALDVGYWDTSAKRVAHATLPALTIEIEPAPAVAPEIALPPDPASAPAAAPPPTSWRRVVREWWRVGLGVAVLIAFLAWLTRRYGRLLVTSWTERRARRAASEAHYFDEVRRAARTGDGRTFLAAAMAWLARFEPLGGTPTFEHLAERAGDDVLAREALELERGLYARPAGQAGGTSDREATRSLVDRMAHARERLSAAVVPDGDAGRDLPPLNPV
jgi:hypothetical protein